MPKSHSLLFIFALSISMTTQSMEMKQPQLEPEEFFKKSIEETATAVLATLPVELIEEFPFLNPLQDLLVQDPHKEWELHSNLNTLLTLKEFAASQLATIIRQQCYKNFMQKLSQCTPENIEVIKKYFINTYGWQSTELCRLPCGTFALNKSCPSSIIHITSDHTFRFIDPRTSKITMVLSDNTINRLFCAGHLNLDETLLAIDQSDEVDIWDITSKTKPFLKESFKINSTEFYTFYGFTLTNEFIFRPLIYSSNLATLSADKTFTKTDMIYYYPSSDGRWLLTCNTNNQVSLFDREKNESKVIVEDTKKMQYLSNQLPSALIAHYLVTKATINSIL